MDISFINNINESEFFSSICKAKDVAMREINDIYDNFNNGNGHCGCEHERHDRMIHNLEKATNVLKDAVYMKAAVLGYWSWYNGNNNATMVSVTRETKPTNGVVTNSHNTGMINTATIS